ncbi:MAG: hypothetical protein CML68_08120 [Rhodobacteraceae bacterium]|nr:hypothetical protein [Paracoccaceae bacterium]
MPVSYTEGGRALFHFEAPDFWTVRAGGPQELAGPDADDAPRPVARVIGLEPTAEPHVWMGFVSPVGISDLEGGVAYLAEIGPHLVKSPEVTRRKDTVLNGMPARVIAGTGRRRGRGVEFTATVVDLPNGRVAVSVVVFEAGANTQLVADVNAVLASLRAAR